MVTRTRPLYFRCAAWPPEHTDSPSALLCLGNTLYALLSSVLKKDSGRHINERGKRTRSQRTAALIFIPEYLPSASILVSRPAVPLTTKVTLALNVNNSGKFVMELFTVPVWRFQPSEHAKPPQTLHHQQSTDCYGWEHWSENKMARKNRCKTLSPKKLF